MKKLLWMVLLFLMIASIALAATASLSIKSSQPLDNQFKAFRAYLDKLSQAEREAWLTELAAIQAEQEGSAFSGLGFAAPLQESSAVMVWLPKSGKKYHSHAGCSNMKNPRQVTREEAISKGFEPCKKCKP